jgi:hypothetical protein
VQRLSSTGPVTLKKVTLDANSSASFRVRLHQGRSRLRVVMPSSQTAPGYITGMSNVLTVANSDTLRTHSARSPCGRALHR